MAGSKNNYCVYYHLNKENGKVYFGMTGSKPINRWKKGALYKGTARFYNAIQKYGWDGFYHRVVVDGLSKGVAELIEKNVINWADAINPEKGYNARFGGGAHGKFTKETRSLHSEIHKNKPLPGNYKKTLCVETREIFASRGEAAKTKGIKNPGNISSAITGRRNTAGGYHWKYLEEETKC